MHTSIDYYDGARPVTTIGREAARRMTQKCVLARGSTASGLGLWTSSKSDGKTFLIQGVRKVFGIFRTLWRMGQRPLWLGGEISSDWARPPRRRAERQRRVVRVGREYLYPNGFRCGLHILE